MRRSKPLAAVAGAALLTLAACGGSGGGSNTTGNPTYKTAGTSAGTLKDPTRQGPAPDVTGAQTGGTVTVYLPGDPGPNDLDPTGGWSVTGNSIQQALTTRSLTQYAYDPATKNMVLVPDLATDLGTPNTDFTSWTFTLKDGLKWEDGSAITAQQVAFGISRSMDSDTFPGGPGTEYSQTYFSGAGTYKGPYTDKGKKWDGVSVSGNDITIKMAKPFPDMDYWGAFMAIGPVPLGNASKPPAYGLHPMSDGPYKVDSFKPTEELTLVKNDQWDPNSDPARHQYVDKWIFKFNADPEQTDQTLLSGNTASQTAMSTALQATNYEDAKTKLGDHLVQQSGLCTSYWSPDYTKITDINVRKALAYAYPYNDVWLASGEIPGVTRVPANSMMPPGMAGYSDFQVDGQQITTNVDKSKELLKKAGFGDKPYPITMVYYEPDPLAVDAQKQITKGLDAAGFDVTAIPVQVSPYDIWLDPDNKINKKLNLRGVNWCADWPSGLTMLPPLVRTGATYNTEHFSEPSIDDAMTNITSNTALKDQPAAWGALDKKILTDYYPIIPTAFRNELFTFGSKIGNPTGDGALAAPNYKDLFVTP
jgi:peptide/nickel transport system substrate-binding protein